MEMATNKLMEKLLRNSPTKYATILSESAMFNNKDVI
jgi:RecA/RadA recombinase